MSLSKWIASSEVKVEQNGVQRAKKIIRKGSRTFSPSKNIAAIDFGTKNCSLAYITENDTTNIMKTGVPKLPLNGTFLRVPTAILFNPEGHVLAFGHDARRLFGNLLDIEYSQYLYFEEIKMNLNHEQVRITDYNILCKSKMALVKVVLLCCIVLCSRMIIVATIIINVESPVLL